MIRLTEDVLVQQTTADYLEQQLGWDSIYAFNDEDFGPESLLGRTNNREVVLTRPLRAKLTELNPGLPDTAYDDAVRQLTATTSAQALVLSNHAMYDLIRDGVQVTYRDAAGDRIRARLRVIDFDEPANNHFLCVRELWVKGDLYRRRADLVGFVNGLPLLFIECKNVYKNLQTAFEGNYADYRDTIPHLFQHNAIVMFGNGISAKSARLRADGGTSMSGNVWKKKKKKTPARWTWKRCSRVSAPRPTFWIWSRTLWCSMRPGARRGKFSRAITSS